MRDGPCKRPCGFEQLLFIYSVIFAPVAEGFELGSEEGRAGAGAQDVGAEVQPLAFDFGMGQAAVVAGFNVFARMTGIRYGGEGARHAL